MLQVCGIPLLEYMISWFAGAPEIEKLYIVMNQSHAIEAVRHYVENRAGSLWRILSLFDQLGYKVEYTNPDLAIEIVSAGGRGTGGDLRSAMGSITQHDTLDEDFVVCNADYVTLRQLPDGALSPQLQLTDVMQYHGRCKQALGTVMTVALVPVSREDAWRFGVAHTYSLSGFHLVHGFAEKPEVEALPQSPWINAGVYVIDRDFILTHSDKYLPDRPDTYLERTLLSELASEIKPSLAAYLLDLHRWFDIGTLKQLLEVNVCVAEEGRARLLNNPCNFSKEAEGSAL
jgi:NDP-sugar pyrophosphorylase family protein